MGSLRWTLWWVFSCVRLFLGSSLELLAHQRALLQGSSSYTEGSRRHYVGCVCLLQYTGALIYHQLGTLLLRVLGCTVSLLAYLSLFWCLLISQHWEYRYLGTTCAAWSALFHISNQDLGQEYEPGDPLHLLKLHEWRGNLLSRSFGKGFECSSPRMEGIRRVR